MMDTRRLSYIACSVFYAPIMGGTPTVLSEHLNFNNNNVYSKSLIVDINEEGMEIPVIARIAIEGIIAGYMSNPSTHKSRRIVIPLYDNADPVERRTFDSLIRTFFMTDFRMRLQKCTTGAGDVYYGGRGIILDSEFNPLLMCTLSTKMVRINDTSKMVYHRPICHISPRLFTQTDKIITKGIIKKLIPIYSSTTIKSSTSAIFTRNPVDETVKIIIDDFDDLFISPVKPTPSTCNNETLNKCLVDNLEEIMSLL